MIPLLVFPVVVGASLAFLNLAALMPAALWAAACLGYGVWMAVAAAQSLRPAGRGFGDGHASGLVGRFLAGIFEILDGEILRQEVPAS